MLEHLLPLIPHCLLFTASQPTRHVAVGRLRNCKGGNKINMDVETSEQEKLFLTRTMIGRNRRFYDIESINRWESIH